MDGTRSTVSLWELRASFTFGTMTLPHEKYATDQNNSAVVRGMILMAAAMLLLPAMDAIGKYLSDSISPGQVTWARFAFQTVFTIPLVLALQGWRGLLPNRLWGNMARGVLIALGSLLFFTTVKYMPLADAISIFFVEPLILTILSAVLLGETVGWRRRAAVVVGLVGALIVIQPSYDIFGPISLLPLATAICFAFYMLLNRALAPHDTPLTMQFSAGFSGTLVMTLALSFGVSAGIENLSPTTPTLHEWGLMALIGALATGGHLMVVQAFKRAQASLLAPFQYLEIVSATILGYLLFGDFPGLLKWLGIAIIIGSGLYVFWRESQVAESQD